jgi:RimJ/RimL family protein N-acetyltransferase
MRDVDILRFTRTPHPMPQGWLDSWLTEFDQERRYGWAVLGPAGEFLGYAVTGVVDREEREVELGYAVAPGARGRGVATETLRQLTRWAFEEGMERVTALISTDNPASSRVAEKVGYTFEGVLRSVHHIDGRRGDLQSWSILPGELVEPSA